MVNIHIHACMLNVPCEVLACTVTHKGKQGLQTFIDKLYVIQHAEWAHVQCAYYQHCQIWWEQAEAAHRDQRDLSAQFDAKRASGTWTDADDAAFEKFQGLLNDYKQYSTMPNKVDRLDLDECGIWVPTAPTLKTRLLQYFNENEMWFRGQLQSTSIDGLQLMTDATHEVSCMHALVYACIYVCM